MENEILAEYLVSFAKDVYEYTGLTEQELVVKAMHYEANFSRHCDGTPEYYISIGEDQICRQAWFHCTRPHAIAAYKVLMGIFDGVQDKMIDLGCGTAPVGFEVAKSGSEMLFVDLDGAGGFEFLKWRLKKHDVKGYSTIDSRNLDPASLEGEGFKYALVLDFLEHITDYRMALDLACTGLVKDGLLVTNFFTMTDWKNKEHMFMDKTAAAEYLVGLDMLPINYNIWVKHPDQWLRNICVGTLGPFLKSMERFDSDVGLWRKDYNGH